VWGAIKIAVLKHYGTC